MFLEGRLRILLLGDPRRELDLRLTMISIRAGGVIGSEISELLLVAVGPRHLYRLFLRGVASSLVLVARVVVMQLLLQRLDQRGDGDDAPLLRLVLIPCVFRTHIREPVRFEIN